MGDSPGDRAELSWGWAEESAEERVKSGGHYPGADDASGEEPIWGTVGWDAGILRFWNGDCGEGGSGWELSGR